MSAIDTKTLKRLAPALEAVKERDAAAFRAKRDAAEALRAEIARLRGAVEHAADGLDQADLAAHSAYLRFRSANLARAAQVESRLADAEAEERAAREKLARSHGSVEGCALLVQRAEAAARKNRRPLQ